MTKSKFSASSIVAPSIFVIHLVNGAQFLNTTCVAGAAVTVISSLINPYSAQYFLKLLEKCNQFRCTGLLHSSKLVHVDNKKLTCFM